MADPRTPPNGPPGRAKPPHRSRPGAGGDAGGAEAPVNLALGRNLVISLLVTLVTLGALVALTWGTDSLRAVSMIRGRTLLAGLSLIVASWGVDTARAWLVARALGHPVPGRVAARSVLAGVFVSAITPFMAGGGAVQALVLSQGGIPYALALASVSTVGVIAQAVLLVVSAALVFGGVPIPGVPLVKAALRWVLVLYGLGLAFVVGALLQLEVLAGPVDRLLSALQRVLPHAAARLRAVRMRSRRFLSSTASGIRTVLQGRPLVTAALALASCAYYLLIFGVAPILGRALHIRLSPGELIAVQFPLFLLASVVPTPGGSGGVEATMAAIVAPHLPLASVGVFVAAWRLITFYPPLVAGAVATLVSLRLSPQGSPVRRTRLRHPA